MTGIPEFPEAVPASALPAEALCAAVPAGVMSSDYQWLSLKSWNPDALVSELDGSLVVDFADYHDPEDRFLGFVGGEHPADTAATLMAHLERTERSPEFRLIDDSMVDALSHQFVLAEDRDQADYLYSTSDLATRPGGRHLAARNEISRFLRQMGDSVSCTAVPPADAPWREMIDLKEKWAVNSSHPDDAFDELAALTRCAAAALEAPMGSEVIVSVLSIDGEPAGFDVTELTPQGWAVAHFRHTPHEILGSYPFLIREVARRLVASGVDVWNTEQDLGLPGLRSRKMKDRPIGFVRKHTASPANPTQTGTASPVNRCESFESRPLVSRPTQ